MTYLITNPADIFYQIGFMPAQPGEVFLLLNDDDNLNAAITYPMFASQVSNYLDQQWQLEILTSQMGIGNILEKYTNPISFDARHIPTSTYLSLVDKYKINLLSKPSPVAKLRRKKTNLEVKQIKEAVEIAEEIFREIVPSLQVGISERQVADKFMISAMQRGQAEAFPTIVAFGENTSYPHHQPSDKKLKYGDRVLIDWGIRQNNYNSDMTRTFIFTPGVAGQRESRRLSNLYTSYEAILDNMNKQLGKNKEVSAASLYQVLNKYYPDFSNTMPHSLGHGIGIEVHEQPSIVNANEKLSEGDVVTIEPGEYISHKFGARIEQTIIINKESISSMGDLPVSPTKLTELLF